MSSEEPHVHPESGIDGLLCPICGQVVESLPFFVYRIVGEYEEELHVCSAACRDLALKSPYVQTSLFARDVRVWTRSVQGELPFNRRNGTPPNKDES